MEPVERGGVPSRVADLSLPRRPALELLHLTEERATVDTEFSAFGWGVVDELDLVTEDGARVVVAQPLVLALHSADEQPADADALELQFDIETVDGETGDGETVAVLVPLPVFLGQHLPRLLATGEHRDVVLALCNPQARPVRRPQALPRGITLWWGEGDVDSWLTADDRITLTARRWHAS